MASLKMYRIATENLNKSAIEHIISGRFDGFSVIEQDGFWKGKKEHSLVIEIQGEDAFESFGPSEEVRKIEEVCFAIKTLNHQEAVLLQIVPSEVYFI